MTGFKNFILRGNLVELAVAFIMAAAFAAVVTATVALIMGLIGKVGGSPTSRLQPGGVRVGAWLTAVIAFVILAAVVYFLVVHALHQGQGALLPQPEAPGTPDGHRSCSQEIRDLLAARRAGPTRRRGA